MRKQCPFRKEKKVYDYKYAGNGSAIADYYEVFMECIGTNCMAYIDEQPNGKCKLMMEKTDE